ncbi:MAG: isochorismatase family protein, partial [Proteobacteria bacterium]|nr:isochorismatase family protein [Pseudomonadota bacterium]
TIATMDTHDRREYKNSDEGKMFPIHCIYGTRGWQSAIDIRQPYTIVKKNVFDVWQSSAKFMERELIGFDPEKTAYESYMMGDDHGGSPMGWGTRPYTVPATCEVYLFGVASDFCVRYAIDGYLKRGYEVFVITDLCRGIENQIDAVAAEFNNQKLHLITTKGATHAKQY